MVNKMAGLGKKTKVITDKFGKLGNGMDRFGNTLGRAVKRVRPSAQQIATLNQGLNRLFGSRAGQMALIRNNISLLQNGLQFLRGVPGSQRRRDQVQDRIRALLSQLNQLARPTAPAFSNRRFGAQGLIDPGLQRQQNEQTTVRGSGMNIVINTSAMDGRTILREVEMELQKRGRRI